MSDALREPAPEPSSEPPPRNKGGRLTNEESRARKAAQMMERAEQMLERFDHEMIPALLVRIGGLAQDVSTPAAIAVQLCLASGRLRELLPPRRPRAFVPPVKTQVFRECLYLLGKLGVPGLVPIDDEARLPPKLYPELLQELRARNAELSAEEDRLRARVACVEALQAHLDVVELRPITAPHPEPERVAAESTLPGRPPAGDGLCSSPGPRPSADQNALEYDRLTGRRGDRLFDWKDLS